MKNMKFNKNWISIILLTISILFCLDISELGKEESSQIVLGVIGGIKILGFLILPLSRYVKINRLYINLCLYMAGSGLLSLILLLYIVVNDDWSINQFMIINFILMIVEFGAFYKIINGKKEDKKEIGINVLLYISILTLISTIILHLPQLSFISEYILTYQPYIRVINIIIYIPIIIALKRYNLNETELVIKKDILIYIYLKIIYNITRIIGIYFFSLYYINGIISLVGVWYIAKIFFVCIVKKPNETLYVNLKNKNKELNKAITELENYSKVIEEDNEHINNLMNAFPESMVILESDKVTFTNTKFKKLFGVIDDTELIGKSMKDILREDYYEQLNNRVEKVSLEGFTEEIEYVFKYKGEEFIGEVTSSLIRRGDKKVVICIIRDITKKILIETLNNTIENNKKENKDRSEVLTNLSHEFKTPVNVIYSAVQMQDLYAKSNDVDNIVKFSSIIKQNCFRLIRLINNFIDITRFESNLQIKSNIKTINIVTLVEDITDSVITYCNNNNISIIFDTESEELYGNFDSEMMDRIMLNLLSNAIKYNRENGSILVNIKETEEIIKIEVKDTGQGISPRNLKKLFNRFERGDKSTSGKKEGTGIGLNIVKSLVEYQKGTIEVTSELGVGSTFTLSFPRVYVDFEDVEFNEMEKEDLSTKVTLELSDII